MKKKIRGTIVVEFAYEFDSYGDTRKDELARKRMGHFIYQKCYQLSASKLSNARVCPARVKAT